ncbi:hypothetical protein KKA27_01510, partial [Patescibacteria group bacterium]|nr:hypothetical protein [Patescibacteria group bacterium]
MPIIKNDTRLINGDFSSAIVATKEYLSNVGYEVDCEEIKEESAEIEAKNLQQSFIKLYLTNSPQIVHFHFEKKSEEQIQIEIKCDLFRKFRIFYYAFLILFLMGSYTFLLTILPKNVEAIIPMSKWESLQSFSLLILISLFCFIFACGFFMRSISTFPYENFMNQFYDSL